MTTKPKLDDGSPSLTPQGDILGVPGGKASKQTRGKGHRPSRATRTANTRPPIRACPAAPLSTSPPAGRLVWAMLEQHATPIASILRRHANKKSRKGGFLLEFS